MDKYMEIKIADMVALDVIRKLTAIIEINDLAEKKAALREASEELSKAARREELSRPDK